MNTVLHIKNLKYMDPWNLQNKCDEGDDIYYSGQHTECANKKSSAEYSLRSWISAAGNPDGS